MSYQSITPGECAAKLSGADRVVVVSGAGLSTAAGVPDFRGPKGLYVTRAYDPEQVFEIHGFDRDPRPFYAFTRDFLSLLGTIRPTFTHRFLVELERRKPETTIITQNIDGMHQRAGSRRVYPMHGDYETAHCRGCGRGYEGSEVEAMLEHQEVPTCDRCGVAIKPDVVFFGENVRHFNEAQSLAGASDLMLALGTSLTVYPAAMLPEIAGGEVVIVNQGEVGMRPRPGVFLADANLDEFFQSVAAELDWSVEE
ncbi:MAG: Sir2 family NAD-dependent protein deacetylase [Planctomycetaceae bacterium]|nr:Sir2 family NAD-dependent protein deacetylase [Planctomycetaceae bacterium]